MVGNDRTINRILELIPEGRENAVSLAYLAGMLNVSERTAKEYVSRTRKKGTPIVGDQYGYYRPANREELQWYYRIFRKRGLTALSSISSARRDLQEVPGQLALEEAIWPKDTTG